MVFCCLTIFEFLYQSKDNLIKLWSSYKCGKRWKDGTFSIKDEHDAPILGVLSGKLVSEKGLKK